MTFAISKGEGGQSQLPGGGATGAFALCVSFLCSWRLDVRERMLAASDGQEAKLGQLKARETADCQGLIESSGG